MHYEWSRRHHAEAELRTNSADDEFVRRAREIEGYDPDTGEYLTR
ncbi:hypothetical protein [Cryptosporangium minutisporangium]|uniref:Uncharacterized protein n=1 Tax=Cryptosporangium minutisporangium TaxID=113569 RepID=A0ABP6SWZ4_9ACTN